MDSSIREKIIKYKQELKEEAILKSKKLIQSGLMS